MSVNAQIRPRRLWPLLTLDRRELPPWILIQSTRNGQDAPLPYNYQQVLRQSFGCCRSLALWHLAGPSLR